MVHFCPDCREARRRVVDRRYKLASAERRKDIVQQAAERLDDPRDAKALYERAKRLSNEAWQRIIGPGDWVLTSLDDAPGEVHVWQPLPGERSARGAEMGYTTSDVELQAELGARADEAANHPWWRENPHWAYALNDNTEARRYLPLPTCGDARGSMAGYFRHKRGNELPCPACAEAYSAYQQGYYRERRAG